MPESARGKPQPDERPPAAIGELGLVEPVAHAGFDRIASMLARVVDAPAAIISLVDGDEEFLPGAF
ncbi:MAG TPA: hypothetical protein VGH24_11895, partial [Solirubrobacteraceae bacterium]